MTVDSSATMARLSLSAVSTSRLSLKMEGTLIMVSAMLWRSGFHLLVFSCRYFFKPARCVTRASLSFSAPVRSVSFGLFLHALLCQEQEKWEEREQEIVRQLCGRLQTSSLPTCLQTRWPNSVQVNPPNPNLDF